MNSTNSGIIFQGERHGEASFEDCVGTGAVGGSWLGMLAPSARMLQRVAESANRRTHTLSDLEREGRDPDLRRQSDARGVEAAPAGKPVRALRLTPPPPPPAKAKGVPRRGVAYDPVKIARAKALLTVATIPGVSRITGVPQRTLGQWRNSVYHQEISPDAALLKKLKDLYHAL